MCTFFPLVLLVFVISYFPALMIDLISLISAALAHLTVVSSGPRKDKQLHKILEKGMKLSWLFS